MTDLTLPGAGCIQAPNLRIHAFSNNRCSPAIISHDGMVFDPIAQHGTTEQGGFISRTDRVMLPTHVHRNVQLQGPTMRVTRS